MLENFNIENNPVASQEQIDFLESLKKDLITEDDKELMQSIIDHISRYLPKGSVR